MIDATNLESAVRFVKANRQVKEIRVDIKGWVRIKRDLNQLSLALPTPYSQVAPEDKWLWHEQKAMLRHQHVKVLGVPVRRIR